MAVTATGRRISAYTGATFRVAADRGGWNASPNLDLLDPTAMTEAVNINLHRGGRETRGGVEKANATAITGSPRIMGIIQFRLSSGSAFTVTATADGKIQKDYGTVLKSGLALNRVVHMTAFRDKLYICNGADRPQVWDGVAASTTDLANVPADWSGTNWPKQIVIHGRGVSERLWAYGVPGKLNSLYASGDRSDNFADGTVIKKTIETEDGFGIVGLGTFGGRLIPIGKRRAYLVVDDDLSTANWGYERAQWAGGVASERLLARTPNDLIAMDESGDVYSIIAVQTSGDYRAVSLSRPPFLDAWIRDHLDLTALADWHMLYDPELRALRIFVQRSRQTQVDTSLVFYVDRPPEEAWVRHEFNHAGGASASAIERVNNRERILVGGYNGHAYRLEDATALDDGISYQGRFSTPEMTFDDPRALKRYDRGWLAMRPQGAEEVAVTIEVDGLTTVGDFLLVDEDGNQVVDEAGNAIVGGDAKMLLVKPQFAARVVNASHPLGIVGTRLRSHVRDNVAGERFFISQLLYDFLPLGPAPQ